MKFKIEELKEKFIVDQKNKEIETLKMPDQK